MTPVTKVGAVACVLLGGWLAPRPAHAWTIGSQLNEQGCHEKITAQALRNVRLQLTTAPMLTPSRDEAALIDDVIFQPPADMVPDLAGMTLLLGVRDNDLKGIDPLSTLDLIQVHGNPLTQDQHCIRSGSDDFAAGDVSAIEACRTFIREQATAALDGLGSDGVVDPSQRVAFQVYVGIAGNVHPQLPLFYIKIGAAMHALEDGYPHTYRTADGTKITTVLNWIDLVGTDYEEDRDGPPHRTELDDCTHDSDPTIARNYRLATQAATDLLRTALDPTLTHDEKVAQFDVVTAQYLGYQDGCTGSNNWCAPAEASVKAAGCDGAGGGVGMAGALLVLGMLVLRRRKTAGALALVAAMAAPAFADDDGSAAPPAAGSATVDAGSAATAVAPAAPPPPIAPVTPTGTEPKRDVKTPSVQEVQEVRKAKELGSPWGFTGSIGGSVDRPAAVATIGLRYRVKEQWLVGVDLGWNPWITTSPLKERAGVGEAYLTLVRRFPMKYDRVNLRSSLHLGASTLLFDVYGAPKYSTGVYGAVSVLGIDYDLGNSWRLVVDPAEFAFPVPEMGTIPLWYEQFRVMIGVQYGS